MTDEQEQTWVAGWPAVPSAVPGQVLAALTAALFDNNPDLVWDFDVEGRVRRVNARITSMLGYAPGEVVGWTLDQIVAPEDLPYAQGTFGAALSGRPAMCTCGMRHRDGRTVVVRSTVIPLVVDGVVTTVYAGCRDVTTTFAAGEALAEREALYSLLVEQSPECVCVYQDERCAYINPAGARMCGPDLTPADVEGTGWVAPVHPGDRDRVAAEFRAVLAGPNGETRRVEKRFLWGDGRVIEVACTNTRVIYRGRPAVHSFARDVTAQRRAEADRLRTQRLEALGRLAAGVAHDFNNLLAVMLVAVEQAADALPPDDTLREDLAEAAAAARRGRALTRQLLTFARREETQPRRLEVNEVVRGMQELLRRIAGPHVHLELALTPDAGAVVADPAQAEQVLLNLVTNARDAMPDGGRIRVETAREDGSLRLSVRDTGVGIPPEVRAHLFDPFFTTKPDGHGLGLATVYGVVTGAGGRVDVESEPGRGAAFHLRLPRAE